MSETTTAPRSQSPAVSAGLLSRRSIVGAVVVLGIALFYAFLLPAISETTGQGKGFVAADPYLVGGNVQITVADGWSRDPSSNEFFMAIVDGSARLVIGTATTTTQTALEAAKLTAQGLANDEVTRWEIGDPQEFTTETGDSAVTFIAVSDEITQQVWVIDGGELSTTLVATAPNAVWPSVSGIIEEIVRSVRFVTGHEV